MHFYLVHYYLFVNAILVILDSISTRLCVKEVAKRLGMKEAQKKEISLIHKFFWKHFEFDRGENIAMVVEYIGIVIIAMTVLFAIPELQLQIYSIATLFIFFFVLSNFCVWYREIKRR